LARQSTPLLARDASSCLYDSGHPPATPSADITEYTLRDPPIDRGASPPAAPNAGSIDEATHHERTSTVPVLDNERLCALPPAPKSVRTVCMLTSISSSLSLNSLEMPTQASHCQYMVLEAANRIPAIRTIMEQSKKVPSYARRFNWRAITRSRQRSRVSFNGGSIDFACFAVTETFFRTATQIDHRSTLHISFKYTSYFAVSR